MHFYLEGYDACLSSNNCPPNPYKFRTFAHSEWQRGFNVALREYEDSFYADQDVRWECENVQLLS